MKKFLSVILITIFLLIGADYVESNYIKANSKNVTDNITSFNEQQTNSSISGSTSGTSIRFQSDFKIKMKAPDFKLKDLNGKEISLSDFNGKNVFLNFWTTWCPSCKAEMPDIEKLYEATKNSDLVILSVDLGESKMAVKSFMSANNYNFDVLLDTDRKAASEYGIVSIPSSFFINKNGEVVASHVGSMTYKQIKEYVDTLNK